MCVACQYIYESRELYFCSCDIVAQMRTIVRTAAKRVSNCNRCMTLFGRAQTLSPSLKGRATQPR
jgi:hypothetical protein